MKYYYIYFITIALVVILASCSRRNTDDNLDVKMAKISKDAVALARDKYSVALNYEFASIQKVDSILGIIQELHKKEPLSEDQIAQQSNLWGAYIGEVIKLKRTSHWERDSELGEQTFPLISADDEKIFSTAWCYKRIINGEEDNVWFKARLTLSD